MLVVPSASGMYQNQPCANQKIVMLPSSLPGRRSAFVKWPNSAELLCFGFFCLALNLFDRKVSRPEASITKRARQLQAAPSSSVAWTVAPSSSKRTSRTRQPSMVCAPWAVALRNRISSISERRTCQA